MQNNASNETKSSACQRVNCNQVARRGGPRISIIYLEVNALLDGVRRLDGKLNNFVSLVCLPASISSYYKNGKHTIIYL